MELPQKIKKIEEKVIRNELDKALKLIQEYSEEHSIEKVRTESITHLSKLSNLERLIRTSQIDDDKYIQEKSKLSAAVLSLKDDLVFYVENPNEITQVKTIIHQQSSELSISNSPNPLGTIDSSSDWFKKVLLALFALFGGATLYFISQAQTQDSKFQIAATVAMLAATWGAKIYDDNTRYRRQKSLLQHQANLNNLA